MSTIGPELPPHLAAKRKRKAEAAEANAPAESAPANGRDTSIDAESETKRQRVYGPAAPPAPLDQRPTSPSQSADAEDTSDDDDYGPVLPSQSGHPATSSHVESAFTSTVDDDQGEPKKTQRDEWMLVPPKQDDLSARMDPTKLRARKFNSSKGAGSAKDGDNALWTETPEQKRKRLRDEMLGVVQPASTADKHGPSASEVRRRAEDEETARKIKEHNETYRGQSLYEQHRVKGSAKDKADDPSKRAFDYEKDMAGGATIGHSQRKEMMKKTADFSSRFTSGSYS